MYRSAAPAPKRPRRAFAVGGDEGDAPSLFQVDAVVEGVPPADDVVLPATPPGQVEPEAPLLKVASAVLTQLPLPAPVPDKAAPLFETSTGASSLPKGLPAMLLLLAVLLAVAMSLFTRRTAPCASAELSRTVDQLPVSTKQEVLSMLAGPRPGIQRLEGRIVPRAGVAMSAPFSSRPCVMYSASASQQRRQDGVHQPPLAYHATGSDFILELDDGSDESGPTVQ
ncbi:unnamed protein product, partial [Polarella glacialis]